MEKLAEALYALNPDNQPWDGDPYHFTEALRRNEHRALLAVKQAEMLMSMDLINEDELETVPGMWEIRKVYRNRS